jgi:asparagine synthase (glutamine-hydrolysing)
LSLVQYLDLKTYLVGDILTKVDRASMAHGLEVRVPFLDHTLVEWTSGLRREHKLRDGEGKWLLKKSLEPNLPRENLYRRKQGFAVPLADWFRGPLRDRVTSVLSSPSITDSGVFDPESLQRLVGEHVARRQDHSAAIWSILMFDAFLRNLHDVPGSASRDPAQVGSS